MITFNEVIDLDTERKVARQVRVPAPVLLLLYGFLIMTAAVLGYVLDERRARIGAFVLFVLLSLYVGIIADLNRPDLRQYQGIAGADADAPAIAEIAAVRRSSTSSRRLAKRWSNAMRSEASRRSIGAGGSLP